MELSSSMDEEQVSEVFVRINSKGKPLVQADFVLSLMSVFWDEGRHPDRGVLPQIPSALDGKASRLNYFFTPNADHLLRVSVALGFRRRPDCNTSIYCFAEQSSTPGSFRTSSERSSSPS